jgi:hypothetical protein
MELPLVLARGTAQRSWGAITSNHARVVGTPVVGTSVVSVVGTSVVSAVGTSVVSAVGTSVSSGTREGPVL